VSAAPSRTERLLEAPIVPTILRFAAPGLLLVVFQSSVSISDTHFVGRLGTEPLAGLALVFPLLMLLQMMSAGAMGGGVSSAIARALGGGHGHMARALAVHATVIALAMGAVFTLLLLTAGSSIYVLLGGHGASLEAALAYSDIIFAGSALVWLANTFASVLRGSGNMIIPAVSLSGAALLHIPLSASLTLGLGPFPRLGIAGAAVAYVAASGFAAALNLGYLLRPRSSLRPRREDFRLEWRLFREILRVGLLSMASSFQTVLTAVLLTGFVGRFGTAALAGYGVGVRLELLQVPLVFAIGQAMVALVGTHIGAGRTERAKQIAFTGSAMAAGICLVIGTTVAIAPDAWVKLFSNDPAVLAASASYLRIVGPFYAFLGLGIALYFASQGAGRVLMPMLAASVRLALVIVGGFSLVAAQAPLAAMFALVAGAMAVYGGLTGWWVLRSDWSPKPALR
jgi:putative MATE family efflux protein